MIDCFVACEAAVRHFDPFSAGGGAVAARCFEVRFRHEPKVLAPDQADVAAREDQPERIDHGRCPKERGPDPIALAGVETDIRPPAQSEKTAATVTEDRDNADQ